MHFYLRICYSHKQICYAGPSSPVGGDLHVSGHLLTQQLLVVFNLLLHLHLEVGVLVPHFIYGALDNTHTHKYTNVLGLEGGIK